MSNTNLSEFGRRRSKRKSYRGMVSIPGFDGLKDTLKSNVTVMDVLIGAAAGAFVGPMVKSYLPTSILSKIPAALLPYTDAMVSALIGVGLYYVPMGTKGAQMGRAIGAGAVAVAQAVPAVKASLGFAGMVSLPYGGGYGMLINERTPRLAGTNGFIVPEPQRALSGSNLADLASMSMGDSDSYGVEEMLAAE